MANGNKPGIEIPKVEHHMRLRVLDGSGNELKSDEKVFREQRTSIREPQVAKWVEKIVKSVGGPAARVEVAKGMNSLDDIYQYDLYDVSGGKASFNAEATGSDPRNVARNEQTRRETAEQDAREMSALMEPFAPSDDWRATGYAWDVTHSLVQFTGERNRERQMFRVQRLRPTRRNNADGCFIPAGAPIWIPQADILTMDPIKETTDQGVRPAKSLYPYFNRIDNGVPLPGSEQK